jgi:hypothetical protein
VIFAHGSDNDARPDAFERIDYGGVANVLRALDGRLPRIVLQYLLRHAPGSLLQ